MTNQPPRELSELMQEFEIEIPLKHRTKFRELCNISTEKIKRLESALKWCKLQRNDYITDVISWPTGNVSARKNEISKCDKELESILEGK